MDKMAKQAVAERLKQFCGQKGSQNKAANVIGISAATVSKVLAGDWQLIKESMWRTIAAQIGIKKKQWITVETSVYKRAMKVLQDAQEESLCFAVCAEAGSGKSLALKAYAEANEEVFVLSCSEYWNKKQFLSELLRVMGKASEGMTVGEMMDDAIRELKSMDYPLLVLDEADKLSDNVLYFFITLYNRLEDECGIVLMATSFLQKRIEKGYRTNRKGYRELYSRVGRKVVRLGDTTATDIAEVCIANGVEDKRLIKKIADDSDGDLRRVRRMVFGAKKRLAQQEEENKNWDEQDAE